MPNSVTASSTRSRLLVATEFLFAKHGFAGLTMRDIAQSASANVASAHYHFGSKEGIVLEMLSRRIEPVNADRMKRLKEARKNAGSSPLGTKVIFSALILPIGEAILSNTSSQSIITQLVARSFSEPIEFIQKMHRRFYGELSYAYVAELKQTYPKTSEQEIYWHFHLAISAMLGALAQHRRLRDFSDGKCDGEDIEGMISRLVHFVSNGFDAGIRIKRT